MSKFYRGACLLINKSQFLEKVVLLAVLEKVEPWLLLAVAHALSGALLSFIGNLN